MEQGLSTVYGFRLKLQPDFTRHLHLCSQSHHLARLDLFHAPEINRIANPDIYGISPTAPQSNTTQQAIDRAEKLPCPIEEQPTTLPTQSGEFIIDLSRRSLDNYFPVDDYHTLLGFHDSWCAITLTGNESIRPVCFDFPHFQICEGALDSSGIVQRSNIREEFFGGVVSNNNFVT